MMDEIINKDYTMLTHYIIWADVKENPMILNNKKIIPIIFSSLIITGISAGGTVSAGQNVVSAEQNTIPTEQKNIYTRQIAPRNYRFPPPNALRQLPAQAPKTAQPAAPVINRSTSYQPFNQTWACSGQDATLLCQTTSCTLSGAKPVCSTTDAASAVYAQ